MNLRVDIREDIKRYQDTLSYASSKVDYSMGQNIYMLPSDMNLKIRSGTVWYNNKILVSDEKFSLGKNKNVNLTVPAIKSHKVAQTATNSNDVLLPHRSHTPNISHKNVSMNCSSRFWKLQYSKSYVTSDIVYVPMNLSLQFCFQNLIKLPI